MRKLFCIALALLLVLTAGCSATGEETTATTTTAHPGASQAQSL